jgi:hypothetical protein
MLRANHLQKLVLCDKYSFTLKQLDSGTRTNAPVYQNKI